MKCPECSHDQKVKYGLTCGGCDYRFTFNPKESQPRGLTDGKFLGCIQAVSQNETSYFTRNQFYAAFSRRIRNWDAFGQQLGCGVVALAIAGGLTFAELWTFAGTLMLIGVFAVISGGLAAFRKITPGQFNALLDRWFSDGKTIDRLIQEPTLHDPPPDWSEPDIYDYGVERILIVERDILVDLFVRNGVHAEQRMLVLSESGYPDYLLPITQRMLTEQPDLPVFLLHDATTHGAAMEERVLASDLLPHDGHPVTDLGMFPTDFQKLKRTKHYDPDNRDRTLPVDAMMLPFLTMGLGAAMTQGMTFGSMIAQQHRGRVGHVGFDFG